MKAKILCALLVICLAVSGADAAVTEGPVRLGVMKFLSRTDGISEVQAAAIGDIFTRVLAGSKTITVVERDQLEHIANEHNMNMSGMVTDETAVRLGKIIGCNYMLIGTVTQYEQKMGETDAWLIVWKKYTSSATIDARIVDVETTKVVMSLSETGTNNQKSEEINLPHAGINTKDTKALEGLESGAIADAVSRLAFRIRENFTGEYIHVVDPGSKEITIELGEQNGAQLGALYRVYAEGKEIFGSDGRSLGRSRNDIAVVKITSVQPAFSTAVLAKGGAGRLALVKKGDKIAPITPDEMERLIKNKSFPTTRPR